MNIFEGLENLNVSEECFDSILDIVEAILEGRQEGETLGQYKQRLAGEQATAQDKKYIDTLQKLIHADQHDYKKKKNSPEAQNLYNKAFKHLKNAQKAYNVNFGDKINKNVSDRELEDRLGDDYRSLSHEIRKENR